MQKEKIDDFLKEAQKENELWYEERQRMQKELHEYERPLLHYIFTLTLSGGSFIDLSSVDGWSKYISLNIDIFNKFFRCKITKTTEHTETEKFNTEQFIISKINRSYNQQMCRCTFEGVEFEVFTNGIDFEVIVDPLDKVLDLHFSQNDSYKLNKFFKRWAGDVLVKSLELDEYFDKRYYDKKIFESIYDSVLELGFYSFVIYTYPESMDGTEVVTNAYPKPLVTFSLLL